MLIHGHSANVHHCTDVILSGNQRTVLSRKLFLSDLKIAVVMFLGQGLKSMLVRACPVQHSVNMHSNYN